MILPTKGIGPDKALLSVGADILRNLKVPKTVSYLWADLRNRNLETLQISFDWFVLALDLLFVMGVVEYASGRVRPVKVVLNAVEGEAP